MGRIARVVDIETSGLPEDEQRAICEIGWIDLDLDTLRNLEEFLEEWSGALVVVSHDRLFLERTTDRIVALRGDGSVSAVPGGVEGWA